MRGEDDWHDPYFMKMWRRRNSMAYREGDPTVELEGRIEVTTAKAYLIEPTTGKKKEVWLPKSQTVSMTEPDENGNRTFVVTEWWHDKAELDE